MIKIISMIKSLELKKNINIKIISNKELKVVLVSLLEEKEMFQYFVTKSLFYISLSDRIVVSDKKTINRIKQIILDLSLWNNRKLLLKGVGSRAELEGGKLRVKVSNTLKVFDIVSDISVKIVSNPLRLVIWGINQNKVDKFKNGILREYPKLKKDEIV